MAPELPLRDQLQAALGGAYRIEEEVGAGGMSRVFAATETALGRRVALKVLQPAAIGMSADRFAREVRLAAKLQQANIVPLLSAGEAGGYSFYTMPLVEGNALRSRLLAGEPLPVAEGISILRDVAKALAYAHAEGVVHRDIKPENILISGGTAVVTDFGIAKAMDAARTDDDGGLTRPGSSLGTPGYMSPEQVVGDVIDQRTDIYAWGIMAWELLAGRHPFADKVGARAIMQAHVAEAAPSLEANATSAPRALCALVMRCLEKDADRRPRSAAELLDVINTIATPGSRSDEMEASGGRRVRSPLLLFGAAGLGLAVLWVAATRPWVGNPPPTADAGLAAVAVLPFDNIGGDTAQEYFADGMTDELATALGRVPGLRVAARSAAYRYKGRRDLSIGRVGAELGVQYLLMGSVRRTGSQLRISAQLTSAHDELEVWSGSYSPSAENLLAAQDSLTSAIADTLARRFGVRRGVAAEGLALMRRGTTDPEAYNLYLKGNYYLNRRRPGLEGAAAAFDSAIARDAGFARAYAGLANTLALLTYFGDRPLEERRVVEQAERALALDSSLADAHVALGIMHASLGRYAAGEAALRRAIAIEPASPAAHFQLGRILLYIGRVREAIEELERAKSLEPYQAATATWLGYALVHGPTPERATPEATRAWELDSSSAVVQLITAMTTLESGRPNEARQFAAGGRARTSFNIGTFAYVLGMTGSPDSTRAMMRMIEARGASRWLDHTNFAFGALALADTARALEAIDRSLARGEPITAYFPLWSPLFDTVRGSSRFGALVRRVGVSDEAPVRSSRGR